MGVFHILTAFVVRGQHPWMDSSGLRQGWALVWPGSASGGIASTTALKPALQLAAPS